MATSQTEAEEKPKAETAEKVSDTGENAVKEEPKTAAEENIEEKTEEEAQDQEAAVAKADSGESDTAPEDDSEKSEPQEPAAEKTPAEQTPDKEATEQAVETDEAETAEKVSDANESSANQEPEAAAEENAADVDTDASDKVVEEKIAAMEESKKQLVSEAIEKMAQSPAELPGEHTRISLAICAKDIMQKDIVWGNPDDSVQQALTKMQQRDAEYMIVGTDGVVKGIVSKSDITGAVSPYLRPIFAKWRRPLDDATLEIKIKWVMCRLVHTIKPETSLAAIMENMQQFDGRCLPVVDQQSKVLGIVTVFDIFKAILKINSNISTTGETSQEPPLA